MQQPTAAPQGLCVRALRASFGFVCVSPSGSVGPPLSSALLSGDGESNKALLVNVRGTEPGVATEAPAIGGGKISASQDDKDPSQPKKNVGHDPTTNKGPWAKEVSSR